MSRKKILIKCSICGQWKKKEVLELVGKSRKFFQKGKWEDWMAGCGAACGGSALSQLVTKKY